MANKKWYGSIVNRVCEGQGQNKKIYVGMAVTEYLWSDRHAYEVIEVISQNEIVIRRYDAVRIDDRGMSDWQDYEYKQDPNGITIKLKKFRNNWCEVEEYNKDTLVYDRPILCELLKEWREAFFTPTQNEKLEKGLPVYKYRKFNPISFGVADEYYDFSF